MMEDYTITKVSWHTQRPRNYEFDTAIIYRIFQGIIEYLEKNNLTVRPLNDGNTDIGEETKIMLSDLTEEGHLFMKTVYNKWMDKVIEGKVVFNDYKLLDKALRKIREVK
jgi:hypothetical protein